MSWFVWWNSSGDGGAVSVHVSHKSARLLKAWALLLINIPAFSFLTCNNTITWISTSLFISQGFGKWHTTASAHKEDPFYGPFQVQSPQAVILFLSQAQQLLKLCKQFVKEKQRRGGGSDWSGRRIQNTQTGLLLRYWNDLQFQKDCLYMFLNALSEAIIYPGGQSNPNWIPVGQ